MGNPSQSCGASPAICYHAVFITCHPTQVNGGVMVRTLDLQSRGRGFTAQ